MVEVPAWLVLDMLSFISIIMLLVAYRLRIASQSRQKRYVQTMLIYMLLLFASHLLGQLARPSFILPGIVGNYLALSLDVGILVFWQAYCEVWVEINEQGGLHEGFSSWLWVQRFFITCNVVLNTVGLAYGWFFYYDSVGTYHRGVLFFPHVAATILFSLLVECYIFRNRHLMPKGSVPWLAVFPVAPFLGGLLQMLFVGLPLEFVGALFSVSLLHQFVQERDANTDFLTGVANRRQLDLVLANREHHAQSGQLFSVLMVDLDKFKQINDTYGHNQGDAALVEVAKLLVRVSTSRDVVARYGGDEFFLVADASDNQACQMLQDRILQQLSRLNQSGRLGFPIELSIGAAVFNPQVYENLEAFLLHLDELLYEDKRRNASAQGALAHV